MSTTNGSVEKMRVAPEPFRAGESSLRHGRTPRRVTPDRPARELTMDFEAMAKVRADFDALVADVRPQLLRYCARMTGSAVDGEDIVQEALAKVYFRLPQMGHVENLRAWLFRVAHNKALDYLRRYDVRFGDPLEGELPTQTEDSPLDAAEMAEWGLSHFVLLTALQRSCVILKDVMSYSLEEISEILDASVPSIKGALHRGRQSLRRQAAAGASHPAPALPPKEADLLGRYVALFNARDFDALRAMLAEDVRLELVGMTEKSGAADVGGYFTNYARLAGMRLEPGLVDGRPALLAREQPDARPVYCLFVRFGGDQIQFIRDYRYARYVFDEAQWSPASECR
jgi:RNA polymerase sigma-70 factor (ECF subfamily)